MKFGHLQQPRMDLEGIMLSEIYQREEKMHYMIQFKCGI